VIVLDTHALVWWVAEPKRIPGKARRVIDAALKNDETLAISSISLWEVAMLVERRRLAFTMDADAWLLNVQSLPMLSFHPVDNAVALRSVRLMDFAHRDPADRMIVATAMGLNATLVTADARLRAYKPLTSVWD
jgi:PIN domain nuclease of toxin-antitoxin system